MEAIFSEQRIMDEFDYSCLEMAREIERLRIENDDLEECVDNLKQDIIILNKERTKK